MYTAKFLHLILKNITKIPFGLRYIAKVMRNKLKSKFPQSTDREVLKIIGNLVYYRFINSAVCSPDMYDVIDTKVGTTLNSNERKNLACISKHLNLIAMSKGVIFEYRFSVRHLGLLEICVIVQQKYESVYHPIGLNTFVSSKLDYSFSGNRTNKIGVH